MAIKHQKPYLLAPPSYRNAIVNWLTLRLFNKQSLLDRKILQNIFLLENIVNPYSYYIGTGVPRYEEFILAQNADNWEVYYTERGSREQSLYFEKEDDACIYLYGLLTIYAKYGISQ